ncbi:hypothetical protein GCG54_00002748 [Colletotrichum gloeosporioides]|uniref:Heterokaryon incompatibility domain-containing protein n=1 Tax=Colletotrichum gloeosporioides TaxID=474922 RepID=A0A8H4FQ20_COLGL|nr:uncharacterized protein GCG54_00002748 [Colletotrichum gloeosporioides]KAF3810290.1 hypothetical protein GCG54_00002748 [Colletotrichum gloeosporioides]
MTSQCESKVHLPLADGQIRLLKLKPASTLSDPIECSLFAIPPTTNTRYEAVSYVWGNQNCRKVIKVNNVDFQITGNLFELLPYLRQHDSDRVLWIDGLCIDQTNDVEKCRQVNMMGDIYKGASHVVIFLGREWDGLDIAIKYLGLAAQQQDAHLDPALEPHLHWKPADPAADFDSYLKWYNAVNSKQDYDTSQWKDQTFPDALIPNLSGRRFILMENGDIGMADAKSQQNDVVMVLAGGKVPLIGDAYVDGKMEGEAVTSNAKWMEVTLI